jgi:hypothetical protein
LNILIENNLEIGISWRVGVFISWSGKNSISHKAALVLREWIPNVIQTAKPWISGVDIDSGAQWAAEMFEALKATTVGIICVTQRNKAEAWINFEAGALAKAMKSSRVCPLLIDLKPTDLTGPLTTLQMEILDKEGLFRVLKMLNGHGGSESLPEETLRRAFEKWWPDLDAEMTKITSAQEPSKVRRDPTEMQEEILNIVRSLALAKAGSEVNIWSFPGSVRMSSMASVQDFFSNLNKHKETVNMLQGIPYEYDGRTIKFLFPGDKRDWFEILSQSPHIESLREAIRPTAKRLRLVGEPKEVQIV